MLISRTSLIALAPLLLLAGCLHPSVSGKILCTPESLACKEFVTIEGVHVRFKSCKVRTLKGQTKASVFCTISNPTNKDLLLFINDFKIIGRDGAEAIAEKLPSVPDKYPVKKGRSEEYVFSAYTKTRALAFLHQGANLIPDTLFTMQWK